MEEWIWGRQESEFANFCIWSQKFCMFCSVSGSDLALKKKKKLALVPSWSFAECAAQNNLDGKLWLGLELFQKGQLFI